MRSRYVIPILTLLLLAIAAPTARAGDPLPGQMPGLKLPPRFRRPVGKVQVGSWVEYSLHDQLHRRRARLHWAMVGKIGKLHWWELSLREARKPVLRIKTLVKGSVANPSQITRVIVQTGLSQALELPLKTGQKLMDVYVRPRRGGAFKTVGRERITVAAGTFDARHITWKDAQGQQVHEWVSKAAGIWGLVRFRTPRFRLELIGFGRGARSKIRGVPAKWRLPGK